MAPVLRSLLLPRSLLTQMLAQAEAERPLECCGLLAGVIAADGVGRVQVCYPLVNEAASPVEFVSEPRSMFEADRDRRRRGLEVLAVYHSHPTSPPVPSRLDQERSYSAEVMNLIISLESTPPAVAAWWLTGSGYEAAEWRVVDDES
jgi:proteasome lid subunit RPN8/RPN11